MKTRDNFQAVFFDMDGLFIDSEPKWLEAETELIAPFGYNWQPEDQVHCLGGPIKRLGDYMSEKSNFAQPSEFFSVGIVALMARKLATSAPLMPGALELAEALTDVGIPIALVSASPRLIVDAVLQNLATHNFAFSISSDDVLRSKPFPDPYLKAALDIGVDITQAIIFEDSLPGIAAAQASGAFVVGVPHLVHVESGPRMHVIKSLRDIDIDTLKSYYLTN